MWRVRLLGLMFGGFAWADGGKALLESEGYVSEGVAYALSTRYAPYAPWESILTRSFRAGDPAEAYWRSAAELRARREAGDLPLAGLHVALDPGHIGGIWAKEEGRDFKIGAADYRVREGELVLEVAQRARVQLIALGAQVTLLRESDEPVNPKAPVDYLELAQSQVPWPKGRTLAGFYDYVMAVRARAMRLSIITGELVERARLVNREIQPDVLISLHINAAPWPEVAEGVAGEGNARGRFAALQKRWSVAEPELQLVQSNHVHVLIFGCLSASELGLPHQQAQFMVKLRNGSGAAEQLLGRALAGVLAEATGLSAAEYGGANAICLEAGDGYLWARNLMLLRMVECPVVLLEPYVANSESAYGRIQAALSSRAAGAVLGSDDILVEYADAVVEGVRRAYGAGSE